MRVEIRSEATALSSEQKSRLRAWIEMGLGRFGGDIAGVTVRFEEARALGAERGQRCQIAVTTATGVTVVVDAVAGQLNRAAARAFLRAESAVERVLALARERTS